MDDVFKIFVEQLREGHQRDFNEVLDPSFLEVGDEDLAFESPVTLKGEAYLAEQELIIHWDVKTKAFVPCSICNERVMVSIEINDFYHSEPLVEIKSSIYNFKELLREIIVLEAPLFVECNNGHCPHRAEYNQFFKEPSSPDEEEDEGFHPFENFDWKS
jgi:uncharacterized metal-binding protein YceD (DUF177 family)